MYPFIDTCSHTWIINGMLYNTIKWTGRGKCCNILFIQLNSLCIGCFAFQIWVKAISYKCFTKGMVLRLSISFKTFHKKREFLFPWCLKFAHLSISLLALSISASRSLRRTRHKHGCIKESWIQRTQAALFHSTCSCIVVGKVCKYVSTLYS